MTTTKVSRDAILKKLLALAVDGWGVDAVYKELEATLPPEVRRTRKAPLKRRSSRIPSTLEAVKRLKIPARRKKVLVFLAQEFEDKKFLPKLSDAKNFLEFRGLSASDLKTRAQLFQRILVILQDMSDDRLERLARASDRTGPAQLGSLADAIRDTGAALRSDTGGSQSAAVSDSAKPTYRHSDNPDESVNTE